MSHLPPPPTPPTPPTLSPYRLDWLLAEGEAAPSGELRPADEAGGNDLVRLPYTLPPEVGEAWAESLALRDGMVLFRAVHCLAPSPPGQLVSVMTAHTEPEVPIFNAQIWLSGLGCHHEYWHGPHAPPVEIIAGPGRDTFRLHRHWRARILVEGGTTSEMRSLILPDALLRTLLGEGESDQIQDKLGLGQDRPTVVQPMPRHVSAPLREALSGPYTGAARKLYGEARVLDYLARLHHHVASQAPRPDPGHRRRIDALHHHLIHLEGRMPTLGELAQQFGLSARRLNDAFAAEYGQSIFNFVTGYRLDEAHASLLTGHPPLKVLAARLGYSHVNHFIAAFKRRFGYPPGSLRRKGE